MGRSVNNLTSADHQRLRDRVVELEQSVSFWKREALDAVAILRELLKDYDKPYWEQDDMAADRARKFLTASNPGVRHGD